MICYNLIMVCYADRDPEVTMLKNKSFAAFCLSFLFLIVLVACGMKNSVLTLNDMTKIKAFYVLIVLLGVAVTGVLAWKIFRPDTVTATAADASKKEKKAEKRDITAKRFWLLALCWGFLYMIVFPPLSSPDENNHYAQAYYNANIVLSSSENVSRPDGKFPGMRLTDLEVTKYYTRPGVEEYQRLFSGSELFVSGDRQNEFGISDRAEALGGVFWAYLPQTVAIIIGRLIHLGGLWTFYLARIFNFATYMALLWFALKWIPFGKNTLGVIALLPMTLHLVASLSYDAVILGLAFFFTAKVLQLAYQADHVTRRDMAVLIASMALLAPIKVIYVLMAFLCFLIPQQKFKSSKSFKLSAAVMAGIVALIFLLVNIPRLLPYLNESNLTLEYAGGAECYTLAELIKSPVRTVYILFNTIRVYGGEHFTRMFGEWLGWLEIRIPLLAIIPCILMLALTTAVSPYEPNVRIEKKNRVIGILVTAGVILLAIFSMLAAWTPTGSSVAEGVQGRYYLPILPIAVLCARNRFLEIRKDPRDGICLALCMVHILTLTTVIETIVVRLGYHVVNGVIVR